MSGYVPMVSVEAMGAAAAFLARDWGDCGYRIGVEAASGGFGWFRCSASDGSEFHVVADRWGNTRAAHDGEGFADAAARLTREVSEQLDRLYERR